MDKKEINSPNLAANFLFWVKQKLSYSGAVDCPRKAEGLRSLLDQMQPRAMPFLHLFY